MSDEGTAVGDETTVAGSGKGADSPPAREPDGARPDGQDAPKVYDEDYVKTLRDEAAANRVKAKRTEEAERRLRDLAVADAVRGILTEPTDLGWAEEYADEHGWPDPAKIRAAAEELVDRKPHLGRPAGEVGQGRHSDQDDVVSLASLLGAHA